MLRDERGTGTCGRTLRIMSAAGLLGLTVAVGMLRGPAKAGEAVSSSDQPREASTAPLYLATGWTVSSSSGLRRRFATREWPRWSPLG